MSISREKLKQEINVILKDADLESMSSKKVRKLLEEKLECDLTERKKEIDQLVMDYVHAEHNTDDNSGDDSDTDKKSYKKTQDTNSKQNKSQKKNESESEEENDNDDGNESEDDKKKQLKRKKEASSNSDDDSDSDTKHKRTRKAAIKKRGGGRKRRGGSDDDGDWKTSKTKGKKAGGGKRSGTGFTRAYKLSSDLADIMGTDSCPRHEVVKKVWSIIKERNLYDPNNKQYAICDAELMKVIGIKRFRTFGMLKYLKKHFLE